MTPTILLHRCFPWRPAVATQNPLKILSRPKLTNGTLLLALSGWKGSELLTPGTDSPMELQGEGQQSVKVVLKEHGFRLSDYEGPASFWTLLLAQSPTHGIDMLSLVAEIPGYLQGVNPLSIEAVTRRLARLINEPANLDGLRAVSNEWEV